MSDPPGTTYTLNPGKGLSMSSASLSRPLTDYEFLHLLFLVFLDEQWRTVPGWPAYKVSSWGRVKSYWRREGSPRNGTLRMVIGEEGRLLKPSPEPKTGHWHVTLGAGKDGTQKTFKLNRLVLMAFDRLPEEGEEARHYFDPDPSNCHLWNLRWGSKTDNVADYRVHTGRHKAAKLDPDQVKEVRELLASGMFQADIAARYGVSPAAIGLISRGKTWQK